MDMNTGFFPFDQVLTFFETKIEVLNTNKTLFRQAHDYAYRYVVNDKQIAF